MSRRVQSVLTRRKQNSSGPFIFAGPDGGARKYNSTPFRRAFDRAGLVGCTAHTLRHTHATRLIQNGLNLYEVKEILGHSNIVTTMRYAHLEQAQVSRKAVDVINLFQPS
jgi:integrase